MEKPKIITETITVLEPDGPETYYRITVEDEEGNRDQTSSNDYDTAKSMFDQAAAAHPDATINGLPPDSFENLADSPTAFGSGTKETSEEVFEAISKAIDGAQKPSSFPEIKPAPSPTSALNKSAVNLKHSPHKKDVDRMSMNERIQAGNDGAIGGIRVQPRVNYLQCASQKVYRSPDGNAFIILGNDRNGHTSSGYGGTGHTQCDAIDICAGMGGPEPKQADQNGRPYWTGPNFFLDAARIYVSQKTDIDENFAIGSVKDYHRSEAKSAIALKADNIRLIGRESLKLVTNSDRRNSQGGEIHSYMGIHLMANNDPEGMQPIPKGQNLVKALKQLDKNIRRVSGVLQKFVAYQREFNTAVLKHQHKSPFYWMDIFSDRMEIPEAFVKFAASSVGKTDLSIMKSELNSSGFVNNFCKENGPNYINSRFNKTN